MDDHEIVLIEVARRGRDGDYTGASEVAALKTRATALESRPNITSLDAVPNVNAPTPANGNVLTWDGTAWVANTAASGIPTVRTDWVEKSYANITTLRTGVGLNISQPSPNNVLLEVITLGSGASSAAARSDHTHTLIAPVRATYGPMGYMSSGTRALGSTSVVLPAGIACIVKARLNMQMRGSDTGQCYYQLRLTINGNSRTSNGGTGGFWCVQGVPDKTTWEHHLAITGTGTAVTVTADVIYHSGGGFHTDAGEIVVDVDTAR